VYDLLTDNDEFEDRLIVHTSFDYFIIWLFQKTFIHDIKSTL